MVQIGLTGLKSGTMFLSGGSLGGSIFLPFLVSRGLSVSLVMAP